METSDENICPKCGKEMTALLPPAADGYHLAPGEGFPRCRDCEWKEAIELAKETKSDSATEAFLSKYGYYP
jgi:hypothetical protein